MTINVGEGLCSDTALLLTVKRPIGTQQIKDGLLVQPPYTTFKSLISPQQPTPQELEVLDEGERSTDLYLFISSRELRTASDHDQTLADYVVFRGNDYKIIYAGDWQTFGHSTCIGVRERYDQNTSGADDVAEVSQ